MAVVVQEGTWFLLLTISRGCGLLVSGGSLSEIYKKETNNSLVIWGGGGGGVPGREIKV